MTVDGPIREATPAEMVGITDTGSAAVAEYRLLPAHVLRVSHPGAALARVTFGGVDPAEMISGGFDQRIKLLLPLPGQREPYLPEHEYTYRAVRALPEQIRPSLRTYTVRAFRPQLGELDVEFVLHGADGPGAGFARRAQPGDQVVLYGPNARYPHGSRINGVEYRLDRLGARTLLIGDETALPAIAGILEGLPAEVWASVFVESAPSARPPALPSRAGLEVHWLRREQREPGQAVLQALRGTRLGAGSWYAWLAGEAGMVRGVRRHLLRERDFAREAVTFLGYWRAGRASDGPTESAPAVR